MTCIADRLDDDMMVRVGDFGLTRDVYERDYYMSDYYTTTRLLPVKWMALESLENGVYNSKTDVVGIELSTELCRRTVNRVFR